MNVLAIGAHYDDIEIGAGGTISKHIKNGDNVTFVVVTDSSYSNHDGTKYRTKKQARQEGEAAAEILGVRSFLHLNHKTKKVEYGVELIEELNAIIDELNIDTIYTHWIDDIHHDHSVIAKATLTAARHVPRVLMYRSNWYHAPTQFKDNFYSDISKYIDRKISSLKAHITEYDRRGPQWIEFVLHQNKNCGITMGVDYAESFEIIKWLEK